MACSAAVIRVPQARPADDPPGRVVDRGPPPHTVEGIDVERRAPAPNALVEVAVAALEVANVVHACVIGRSTADLDGTRPDVGRRDFERPARVGRETVRLACEGQKGSAGSASGPTASRRCGRSRPTCSASRWWGRMATTSSSSRWTTARIRALRDVCRHRGARALRGQPRRRRLPGRRHRAGPRRARAHARRRAARGAARHAGRLRLAGLPSAGRARVRARRGSSAAGEG